MKKLLSSSHRRDRTKRTISKDCRFKDNSSVISYPGLHAMNALSQKIDKATGYLSWGRNTHPPLSASDKDDNLPETRIVAGPSSNASTATCHHSTPKDQNNRHLSWLSIYKPQREDDQGHSLRQTGVKERCQRQRSDLVTSKTSGRLENESPTTEDCSSSRRSPRSSVPSSTFERVKSCTSRSTRDPKSTSIYSSPEVPTASPFTFSPLNSLRKKSAKVVPLVNMRYLSDDEKVTEQTTECRRWQIFYIVDSKKAGA